MDSSKSEKFNQLVEEFQELQRQFKRVQEELTELKDFCHTKCTTQSTRAMHYSATGKWDN